MESLDWGRYYWEVLKVFGQECYGTWRQELMASVLAVLFIFLIDRASIALKTGLIATAYTLGTLAVLHLIRTPWLIQRKSMQETHLHWRWGILGTFFALGVAVLWLYTAAWFYTMQPKIVMVNRTPDERDAKILMLRTQLANRGTPERPDSLRRRTLKLADEVQKYLIQRATDPNKPPVAVPDSRIPNPTEQQKEAIKKYQAYQQATYDYYFGHYRDLMVGIVKEYESKGVNTGWLESTLRQRPPYFPTDGSAAAGTAYDELYQFRELAYHVDADDDLITIAH